MKKFWVKASFLTAILFLLNSQAAIAAELSLVSGAFKASNTKKDGDDAGGTKEISIGARYSEIYSGPMHWFGYGLLSLKSYDSPKNGKAPSDSTGLSLVGGLRYYFYDFSEVVLPFASGHAGFLTDKTYSYTSDRETEKQGLIYGASIGFRFEVDRHFFFDLESQLFESYLWGTEKSRDVNGQNENKEETSKFELYFRTASATNLIVGAGMKF